MTVWRSREEGLERTFWRGEMSEQVKGGLVGRGPGNGRSWCVGHRGGFQGHMVVPIFTAPGKLGPYPM